MKKKIVIVTDRPRFSRRLIRYSLRLSRIMGYDVAALFVDTREGASLASRLASALDGGFSFAGRARRAASSMARSFAAQGVDFEHVVTQGPVARAVEDLQHRTKRVEMALIEIGPGDVRPVQDLSMPVHYFDRALPLAASRPDLPGVFKKICNLRRTAMSSASHSSKSSHLGKAAAALAASAGIYAAVFANETTVTTMFTRGGLYAALPIAAAFAFSFVYASFAHSFWAMLGIEAHRKTQVVTRKAPAPRTDIRPRPTLNA
jgi:hypothetical protein